MYLSGFQSTFSEMQEGINKGFDKSEIDHLNKIMFDWYNLFLWIAIPIFALFTFLLNKKSGYNYAENLVLHTFYLCGMNVLVMVMMPLNLFLNNEVFFTITFIFNSALFFYMILSFFQQKRVLFIMKNIFGYIMSYFIYMLVLTILGVLFINAT